jgi:hypothetical protein
MKGMIVWLLPLLTALCVWSCSPGPLTEDALKAYALDPEHGLHKTITDGDVAIDLIYRPKDLVIAQEVGVEDPDAWSKEAARIDSLDYFVLTIKKSGKAIENYYSRDPKRFQRAVSYLSDGITEDLHLRAGEKSIGAEGVAVAQGFGLTNASNVLVVFKSMLAHRPGSFTVEFDGTELDLGVHRFEFDAGDLRSIPPLIKK